MSQKQFAQFLRDERARKLETIGLFENGRIGLSERRDGELVDTSLQWVETLRGHIAEIENILNAAGEPLDS